MSRTAVIILNWNGVKHGLLRRYLPSVLANTAPELGEVIVADNGSTDDSLQVMKEEFPEVRVIALGENYGFAEGYNRAIAQVEHEYVVLLNDDVRASEDWLQPLVQYMDSHPECGGLQPKLLSDRDPRMFEYAGAAGGYLDKLGYPYCRGRIFQDIEEDHGQYDDIRPIMWATGACLMVRRQLYLDAGGLDTRFFAHMEEIDLCWRIRRMGYQLVCVSQSVMYHLGGASLAMGHPRKTKLNFRNSLLMLWKNLPKKDRNRLIFRRKLLDGIAALNFLLHCQFSHVHAIWQAHREADQMIRDYYSQDVNISTPLNSTSTSVNTTTAPLDPHSSQVQLSSTTPQHLSTPEDFPESRLSILWQYYVKGKKHFSEIL